jgi:AsmA protein
MRMPVRRLSRRPRRSPLRVITYFALGFIAVVALVVVAAFELINPNAYKPQIEAAAERATGRALTLSGPITIVSYTRPTIAISDVAFANMQGGSKPQMLTVRSIEADIGWRALLQGRVTIPRLVLDRPELLLETDKQGHGNWEIAAPGKAAPAAAAGPQAGSQVGPGARPAFSIQTLHVKDAQVTWHDGRTGRVTVLSIPRLSLTAASLASPVTVTADITAQTHSMQLTGQIGPLERLFGATATDDKAWPVDLHATTQGAQLALSGTVGDPRSFSGYALRVQADVIDMADLAPLSPVPLPALRDLSLSATVADHGGLVPAIEAVALRLGRSELDPILPGVSISEANISSPAPDQPIHVAIQGALRGAPLSIIADLGAPAALTGAISGKPTPFPVDIDLEAASARLTAKGAIADPAHLRGTDVAITAAIPDLSALSPLALRPLPPLRNVAFAAHLQDSGEAGGTGTVAVHGLSLSLPEMALGGELAVTPGAVPRITGTLAMPRLDLDKLTAILSAPVPGQLPPPPAPPTQGLAHIFSATPFPVAPLHLADLDLKLQGTNVVTGGGTIGSFAMHATAQGGDLELADGAADLPGGHVTFTLGVDARTATPKVALKLTGPALATAKLLAFLGIAPLMDGTAQLHVDVAGSGVSPHAVAGDLGGTVGLAMAGGSFDGRMLGPTLDSTLHVAAGQFGGDNTELRCLAVRLDIAHGVAKVEPLLIDSPGFVVSGGGSAVLGDETIALLLRPDLRVAGAGLGVPVSVTGPILAPRASPDGGAAVANLASLATSPIGDVKGIAGAVGQTLFGGNTGADPCPAALSQARFGLPGAAAPALGGGIVPGVVKDVGKGLGGAGTLLKKLIP